VQVVSKIDEAGTHENSAFMIMGGYAARLWQWNRFDKRWKDALRDAGLKYFHVNTSLSLKQLKYQIGAYCSDLL
jgi:hypothetical protein